MNEVEVMVPEMTPQQVLNRLEEISELIKSLSEEKSMYVNEFFSKYQDFEFLVTDKDGKDKFFRIYEVDGRFVYNSKYEVGLRVKPVKVYSVDAV